jgi:5-methylcytosine-specific restriction protein B
MTFSESVQRYFQDNYVTPARQRGQTTIDVKAGELHRKLGWTRRVPLVCAALSSRKLQRNVGVRLSRREGPPSGQSPTVVFHYEILGAADAAGAEACAHPSGIGLMDLYGIGAEVFRQLGGGEEYLRREREELRFPAEQYPRAEGSEKP